MNAVLWASKKEEQARASDGVSFCFIFALHWLTRFIITGYCHRSSQNASISSKKSSTAGLYENENDGQPGLDIDRHLLGWEEGIMLNVFLFWVYWNERAR